MNHLGSLLPTLAQYAQAAARRIPGLEADDLAQEMALAILEHQAAHPEKPVNAAYLKRCAWFARSSALRKTYAYTNQVAELSEDAPDETDQEELALEQDRLSRLQALIPQIRGIVSGLAPANQQIVNLILLDLVEPGDLPRATGLSYSAISHRKKQIRRAFEAAGLTRDRLPL